MARVALITGATSGIGEAVAMQLAKQNYALILTGRRQERLQALAEKLNAKALLFDLAKEEEVQKIFLQNQSLLSTVDVLVNNAGLAKGTDKIQEAKFADFQQMIHTNLTGLVSVTQKILPSMVQRNAGHIVNIGSVSGRWVYPGGAVYCATKHAVRAFSEGLRMDLLGTQIRVTNIEPGMVQTEFSQVRLGSKAKADLVYQGMTPLRAEDVAEAVVWSLLRPAHVNIQELILYPTDQAHVTMTHRR